MGSFSPLFVWDVPKGQKGTTLRGRVTPPSHATNHTSPSPRERQPFLRPAETRIAGPVFLSAFPSISIQQGYKAETASSSLACRRRKSGAAVSSFPLPCVPFLSQDDTLEKRGRRPREQLAQMIQH